MVWSAVVILVPFHIYAHALLSFLILVFFLNTLLFTLYEIFRREAFCAANMLKC